jgi:hypothetical protein
MALTNTTLAAACTASDTLLTLTSTAGAGFPAVGALLSGMGQPMQIDGEVCYLVSTVAAGVVKVRSRGAEGTEARAHDLLAPVSTSPTGADFPVVPTGTVSQRPPQVDDMVTIGQNTAIITLPGKNTVFVITKATALASTTLPVPTVAQNGLRLTFTSQTAAAHVITSTTGFNNGLTGSPWTTATFAAFIGAGFSVVANNGTWNVTAAPVTGSTVVLT